MSEVQDLVALYGVKYVFPYDRKTMKPYVGYKVVGGATFERNIEKIKLQGGHAPGAWQTEAGEPENPLEVTVREIPDSAFEIFEDAEVVKTSKSAVGVISAVANTVGTSVSAVITGVTVASGKDKEIPLGDIVFEATASGTVNVYLKGTSEKLTTKSDGLIAKDLDVSSTGTISVAELGVELAVTSGTLTIGDSAYVTSTPAHNGVTTIKVGGESTLNEVGVLLVGPVQSTGVQVVVDFPKVSVGGLPMAMNSREFAEHTLTMEALFDFENSNADLYTVKKIQHAI